MGSKMNVVEEEKKPKGIKKPSKFKLPFKLEYNKEKKEYPDVKDIKLPKSSKDTLILWFKIAVSSMILFMVITIYFMMKVIK